MITIPISQDPLIPKLERRAILVDINGIPADIIFDEATGKATFDKLDSLFNYTSQFKKINIPPMTLEFNFLTEYLDPKNNIINLVRLNPYNVVLKVDNTTPVNRNTGQIVTDVIVPYGPPIWYSPTVKTEDIIGEYDFFFGAIAQGADPIQMIIAGAQNADKQFHRFDI